jgi:hypothetical protein
MKLLHSVHDYDFLWIWAPVQWMVLRPIENAMESKFRVIEWVKTLQNVSIIQSNRKIIKCD